MKLRMAVGTERYEIVLLIVTEHASELNMVDLKVLWATVMLAAPAITVQYPLP